MSATLGQRGGVLFSDFGLIIVALEISVMFKGIHPPPTAYKSGSVGEVFEKLRIRWFLMVFDYGPNFIRDVVGGVGGGVLGHSRKYSNYNCFERCYHEFALKLALSIRQHDRVKMSSVKNGAWDLVPPAQAGTPRTDPWIW